MTDTKGHVTIIGAGIVGVSCAAFLQREGFDVTVVDWLEPGQGTSFGNAGSVSPSAILPVAMPGMVKKLPRWLLDPLGPLTVRWSYLPWIAPWLLRFIRHASRDEALRVATAMRDLMGTVFDDYRALLSPEDFAELFRRNGCLYVYGSGEELAAAKWSLDLRRNLGAEMVEIGGDDIRQLEPALNRRFEHGIFAPENGSTIDPYRLVNSLADEVKRRGGKFVSAEVKDVVIGAEGPTALETTAGRLPVDRLVLAAGAWSSPLAKKLGAKVPLETQRGYHVTFANPQIKVNRTVMWNTRSVFINPMECGLRIAGTVELAGLKAAPNYARADKLTEIAREMFPGLDTEEQSKWMGHRPCLPDSLPVIDRSPKFANTIFAFGHQHVGICSGGPTGRHVAALMAGKTPAIDLTPFSVNRF
ncbi:NAD(P)/FAD-dependent oxidoreductase [Pararhodobacter oceanensis]|uniref:NAD(P)/FAD-dependent oxidoreductase n=1 Tax=Pararhodobacter oceanensis TaxID=2172121 RepID=UPI003A8E1128